MWVSLFATVCAAVLMLGRGKATRITTRARERRRRTRRVDCPQDVRHLCIWGRASRNVSECDQRSLFCSRSCDRAATEQRLGLLGQLGDDLVGHDFLCTKTIRASEVVLQLGDNLIDHGHRDAQRPKPIEGGLIAER